jgi:D-beta-D-heptose 7-phosphate kinase/D-beta-D-heptose 1-phosphate adenosyltransferase
MLVNPTQTIFTYGIFDILHAGHVSMFNFAKTIGNHLVVAIPSDTCCLNLHRSLKRPYMIDSDRKYILESLKAVDEVIIYNKADCLDIIKMLNPNYLIMAELDMERSEEGMMVEKAGGKLIYFQPRYNRSVTNISNLIKEEK